MDQPLWNSAGCCDGEKGSGGPYTNIKCSSLEMTHSTRAPPTRGMGSVVRERKDGNTSHTICTVAKQGHISERVRSWGFR